MLFNKLGGHATLVVFLEGRAEENFVAHDQDMLPLALRVILVANFAIFEVVIEVLLRLLSLDHVAARRNQSVYQLGVVLLHFPVAELLETLMLVNDSLLFMNLRSAFTQAPARE